MPDPVPVRLRSRRDSHLLVMSLEPSALKGWASNDYGDGSDSLTFFEGNIPAEQKKKAKETRALVERFVGRFSDFKDISDSEVSSGSDKAKLASTIFSRSLQVQWIQGSSEVAEATFFKINSQGTVLDDVEELLLKNRRKSYAIGARSVVRSGTGHKYWSSFEEKTQKEIENLSEQLNRLMFQPEISEPIKTLDLPLGGTASPVDALKERLINAFGCAETAA